MRSKLLCLSLVFLISACTFQMEVLTTPTPAPTETVLIPVSATPTSLIGSEGTATPFPLPTATGTATPMPPPVGSPGVSPIQFGPNGTYADILDTIQAGRSKTYSVRALKGQVMSVSIHQNEEADWASVSLRIIGADDSVLCSSDCEFWRGVLPATQDYYVTVTPASDASDFVLRVAVNPPGNPTQSFVYENKYRNASLSYTDEFAPVRFPGAEVSKIVPELSLQFIDTPFYTKTNLSEAYLLFGSSTDPQDVSTCTEPVSLGAPESVVGEVTINGVSYTKSEATGVGAGNIYETTYYRTVHDGTCFEITYFVHYGNIGNYDPNEVTEFDKTTLLQKFDRTLESLVLE